MEAKDVYPYDGLGFEHTHQVLLNALQELGWMDHALWAVQPQNTEVTGRERTEARRLIDAIKAMEAALDYVHDVERKMRPTREGVENSFELLLRQQNEKRTRL